MIDVFAQNLIYGDGSQNADYFRGTFTGKSHNGASWSVKNIFHFGQGNGYTYVHTYMGFPGGLVVQKQPANSRDTEDMGSIPGLGRSPGEGNGNPPQYSGLEKGMAIHSSILAWSYSS